MEKACKMCLGFEPWTTGWKTPTNLLRYGGHQEIFLNNTTGHQMCCPLPWESIRASKRPLMKNNNTLGGNGLKRAKNSVSRRRQMLKEMHNNDDDDDADDDDLTERTLSAYDENLSLISLFRPFVVRRSFSGRNIRKNPPFYVFIFYIWCRKAFYSPAARRRRRRRRRLCVSEGRRGTWTEWIEPL